MKIISGKWGGQSLDRISKIRSTPELRPTSNKVREAVFDILESRVVDDWPQLQCLDLFSGSGAYGFECLSRGAAFVDFVESHLPTSKELQKILKTLEADEFGAVHTRGALEGIAWLQKQGKSYDLVFMDPPYREGWIVPTMNKLAETGLLKSRGLVVAEHDKREHLTPLEGFWKLVDARRYGDTMVSFFCPRDQASYWESRFGKSKDHD